MAGGSPFQTFYLMFKNNAKETEKDVVKLGETTKKTKKEIKDTKDETNQLGRAFTDAVENGGRALAAYVSFNAMKNGIVNTQQFNRELTINSKLWGQNANEIAAWGAAVKQAGGSEQGLFSWYQGVRQQNAALGRSAKPIGQIMEHIAGQVKGMDPANAQRIFAMYGLSDPGAQALLMGSAEDRKRAITEMEQLTKNTQDGAAASQEFGTSWDKLTTSLTKFWTAVNSIILPPLAQLFNGLTSFFNMISENGPASAGFFGIMTVATIAFSAAIGKLAIGFLALSSAALSTIPAIVGVMAPILAAVGIGAAAGYGLYKGGKWLANGITYDGPASGGVDSSSAMNYLMSKHGLSSAQAAGIVANMQAESGGKAGAIGDGGRARGLFQWHPDRQAKILAGTGIDVTKASWAQQMDAAMWELKTRPEHGAFMGAKTPFDAASIFSQRFEVPAGGIGEAMKRGNMAMQIAGSTPFASQTSFGGGGKGGTNVSVGEVTVNTQATDAAGIAQSIGGELQRQIQNIFSQNNDAVAY